MQLNVSIEGNQKTDKTSHKTINISEDWFLFKKGNVLFQITLISQDLFVFSTTIAFVGSRFGFTQNAGFGWRRISCGCRNFVFCCFFFSFLGDFFLFLFGSAKQKPNIRLVDDIFQWINQNVSSHTVWDEGHPVLLSEQVAAFLVFVPCKWTVANVEANVPDLLKNNKQIRTSLDREYCQMYRTWRHVRIVVFGFFVVSLAFFLFRGLCPSCCFSAKTKPHKYQTQVTFIFNFFLFWDSSKVLFRCCDFDEGNIFKLVNVKFRVIET